MSEGGSSSWICGGGGVMMKPNKKKKMHGKATYILKVESSCPRPRRRRVHQLPCIDEQN